jgi:hypothetical protein
VVLRGAAQPRQRHCQRSRRPAKGTLKRSLRHLELDARSIPTGVSRPVAAPADALRSGDRLPLVAPGRRYTATFSITVQRRPGASLSDRRARA